MSLNIKPVKEISFLVFLGFGLSALLFFFLIFPSEKIKSDRHLSQKLINEEITNNQSISFEEKLALRQKTQNFFSLIEEREYRKDIKESQRQPPQEQQVKQEEPEVSALEPKEALTKSVPVDIWNDPLTKIVPQFYIDYLNEVKSVLISDGFLTKKTDASFEKLNDVISFWVESLDYFIQKGIIKESRRSSLLVAITSIWPATLEVEKYMLPNWPQAQAVETRKDFDEEWGIEPILKQLTELFSPIKSAFASPICFKYGITILPPPGGVNLWSPCCACYAGTPPTPIGCLNAPWLGALYNAIWDLKTGICGIG
jgi:hypothetical protein